MHATVKIVFRQGYTFISGNCWEIRVRKLKTSTDRTDAETDTELTQKQTQNWHKIDTKLVKLCSPGLAYSFISENCWKIRVRKLKYGTELVQKLTQNWHKTCTNCVPPGLQFHPRKLGKLDFVS